MGLKSWIKYCVLIKDQSVSSSTAFLTCDGLLYLGADNDRTIHEHYNDFSNYYNEPPNNFDDPYQRNSSS